MIFIKKKYVRLGTILALLLVFSSSAAWGHASKAWKALLDARTTKIWVDAQVLGDLVLNTRAEVDVVWLPRSLSKPFEKDKDAYDWIAQSLGYYFDSNRKGSREMKGHDVFVLNYRTLKNWTFDPTELVIAGYRITPKDVLTDKAFRVIGELPSGEAGILAVRAPSLKPGATVEISLGNDRATFEVPGK